MKTLLILLPNATIAFGPTKNFELDPHGVTINEEVGKQALDKAATASTGEQFSKLQDIEDTLHFASPVTPYNITDIAVIDEILHRVFGEWWDKNFFRGMETS